MALMTTDHPDIVRAAQILTQVPRENRSNVISVIGLMREAAKEGEHIYPLEDNEDPTRPYQRGRVSGYRSALFFLCPLSHSDIDHLVKHASMTW